MAPCASAVQYDDSALRFLDNRADRGQQLLDLATRMQLCWLTDGNIACHPFSSGFTYTVQYIPSTRNTNLRFFR